MLWLEEYYQYAMWALGNDEDMLRRDRPTNPVILETSDLTKRYGEQIVAVDSLNLKVRRGEVYGFLGPDGAGKTTTLRKLLGLIRPTSGIATVLGEPPGTAKGLAKVGALRASGRSITSWLRAAF